MWSLRELAAAAGVLAAVETVVVNYRMLPERIATHFNGAGVANGFGPKSTLWLLVGVELVMYGVMSIINFVPPRVNSRRALTVEQRAEVWRLTLALVGWMKAEMACLLAYLCYSIAEIALGERAGLGVAFRPLVLIVVFGTVVIFVERTLQVMRSE